jgi:hypothetical protein
LYQYSLDRKRPLHTYTCEQNAQILLRLERERLKKYGSYGRLVGCAHLLHDKLHFHARSLPFVLVFNFQHFTSLSNADQQQQQQPRPKQPNNCRNDNGSLKDFNTTRGGYPDTNHHMEVRLSHCSKQRASLCTLFSHHQQCQCA